MMTRSDESASPGPSAGPGSESEDTAEMRRRPRRGSVVGPAAVLTYLALAAGLLSGPLSDIDFWWHIATGREIVEQGEVPVDDPFGMYSDPDPVRRAGNLRSQWLGQVALFVTFDRLGVTGVVALRAGLLMACLALVLLRGRLNLAGPGPTWVVLLLSGALLTGFTGERPQLFSFFFAGLLFLLLDAARARSWKWLLPVPLLGLVWANSHGGFLLGNALLLLVLLGRLPMVRDSDAKRWAVGRLALVAGAFVLATLVTPSGLNTYVYLLELEGSLLQSRTSEYMSSLLVHRLGFGWLQWGIYAWLALAALSLPWLARRDRLDRFLVVAFLILVSLSAYRYLSFSLVVGAPYVALGLSDALERFYAAGRAHWPRWERLLVGVLLGSLGLGLLSGELFRGGISAGRFPTEATRVIAERGTEGRAFNTMAWGGYLLWHVGERVTPFLDGRLLDPRLLAPYTNALWATPAGLAWFRDQPFSVVVLPHRSSFDDELYPLPFHLAQSPNWQLVYRDEWSHVFERVDSR